MPPVDAACVVRGAELVRQRISAAGGDPDSVAVVAVTKGFDASAINAAAAGGLSNIGENYAQEMSRKLKQLDRSARDRLKMHFIGRLQSNKVRVLAESVDLWQSVDRPRLVDQIASHDPGAEIFVQLNIGGSAGQGGCGLADAPSLVSKALQAGLSVRGAMAIGPQGAPAQITDAFTELVRFADRHDLEHRCIGMSADLELAVRAGSTMVRIGTALFGPRPSRRPE